MNEIFTTGKLIAEIPTPESPDDIEVGMPGTYSINGDSYPVLVHKVTKTVVYFVDADEKDGVLIPKIRPQMVKDNTGEYTLKNAPCFAGKARIIRGEGGRWGLKKMNRACGYLSIGRAVYRQDPHF